MSRFIEGEGRKQATLFPDQLDDFAAEDNPVRVIDLLIDDLKCHAASACRRSPSAFATFNTVARLGLPSSLSAL